jgi:hypothetical protein
MGHYLSVGCFEKLQSLVGSSSDPTSLEGSRRDACEVIVQQDMLKAL